MRRQLAGLLGFLVAAVALASCGGLREVESDGYVIYVHSRDLFPPGGPEALIIGVLAVKDGCVVLQSDQSGSEVLVVWPAGTSIASTDPFAIRLLSGVELALGDKVTGGGGYHDPEKVEADIPPECLTETNEVAVFNYDSELVKD